MTRLLIDTSAYSVFKRGEASVANELRNADEIVVSSVVLGELRAGFAHGASRERNESELPAFLALAGVRTVGIDDETSVHYATLYAHLRRNGTPVPSNDLWIAATAVQHDLILLTRDEHFRRFPQIVVRGLV